VNEKLHARVRRMREQSIIRAWEYRQRSTSKGVWHRLRRTLVNAAEAWIIDEEAADMLEARGRIPLLVGYEFAPRQERGLSSASGRFSRRFGWCALSH